MTSWSSFQASLWDGEQAAQYTQAKAGGQSAVAAFYEARFPPEMQPAFQAWMRQQPLTNPAADPSPIAAKAYRPAGEGDADRLDKEAIAAFDAGQKANGISDIYTQRTVLVAMALFFGGIGKVFKIRGVRLGLLAIAVLACVVGFVRIFALPPLTAG